MNRKQYGVWMAVCCLLRGAVMLKLKRLGGSCATIAVSPAVAERAIQRPIASLVLFNAKEIDHPAGSEGALRTIGYGRRFT